MSKYRKQVPGAVAAIFLMAGLSWAASGRYKTLEIGQRAPDFNLPGVDGREYRLADFATVDVLVIVFTCNHCPTAQAYEERIKKLAADYKSKILSLLKKQQTSCRNYLFDSEDEYQLMSAVDKDLLGGVPYTILIQPGGRVIYRGLGMVEPLELKKAIVGYLGRYYK